MPEIVVRMLDAFFGGHLSFWKDVLNLLSNHISYFAGPLTLSTSGKEHVVGVVSWGIGCGRPNLPSVYAKVSSANWWIHQVWLLTQFLFIFLIKQTDSGTANCPSYHELKAARESKGYAFSFPMKCYVFL